MSSQPPPTDHFEMNVNALLAMPEIQEIFKRDTFSNEFVPTTASDAGIRDTVAESQPDDLEEKLQVQEQDLGERHQLQSLSPSALVMPTEADKTKEPESKTPGISPIDFGNPTAKVVHEICATEREDLRRKTQVLTGSLRRSKRDNMDVTHQQRQLRSELCRLLQIEAQLKEYEKRSVESLEVEFQMLQQEVANLSDCVEAALQEEIDWIDRMKSFQRKQ